MVAPSRTSSAALSEQRDPVRHRPGTEAYQRNAGREGQQREAVNQGRFVVVARHVPEGA